MKLAEMLNPEIIKISHICAVAKLYKNAPKHRTKSHCKNICCTELFLDAF